MNRCRSRMKVQLILVLIFMTAYSSTARRLVKIDGTEKLLKKFVLHGLSESESKELQEIFEILRRTEPRSSKLLPNQGAFGATRESLNCVICRSAFTALFEGVSNNHTDSQLIESVTTLCTSLGFGSFNVCKGIVGLNMPIITYIIRNTPDATPRTFCGLFYQNAYDSNYCPYYDPRFEWQVNLPGLPHTIPTVKTDAGPLKVAIITDTHIDPLYEAYGVADCEEPTCCRKGQIPAQNYVYKFNVDESLYQSSIININNKIVFDLDVASKIREQTRLSRNMYPQSRDSSPAGYWGDYRNCDTPIWAFDDVIERIAETHKDIDVVYYIGDTIDHGIWETTYALVNKMNQYLVDKMRSTFNENVLVIPVIGNHDAQPTNQYAPTYVKEEKLNTTWLYQALENKWDHYLTKEAKESFLQRGGFSILVRPGLRVISINNNVAFKNNWWLVFDPLDAKRHLDWLVEELRKAEINGEKVHILAHIPPGVADLTHTWTREYNRIVNRFSSTITAQFNGHVHSDEFKIFYSLTDGSPINVAWGGGSATAYSNYNLNYKIVEFNSQAFEPERIVNYVYNVSEANLTPNNRPKWFPLYEMKDSFELKDLSPTSMNQLVYKMTNDTRFLNLYSAFFSKLSDNLWLVCDESCKLDNLCKIVVSVLWERRKCEELTALYHSKHHRVPKSE